jgi:hypothetical protein
MKLSKSSIDRVASAFAALEVGDPRRARRVRRTVENLAANPRASFPEAMGSDAEIEGAYRLMSSSRVTMSDLNDAHAEVTVERARAVGRVLAIHDTTTFEFKHAEPEEVGFLNTGKAGFMAHYALIVGADDARRPLGIANVETISRESPPKKASPKGYLRRKRPGSQTVTDPARESLRWFRGFDNVSQRLMGVEVIHVADREGDNYDLFARAISQGLRFVIRARVLARRVEGPNSEGKKEALRTVIDGARGVLTRDIELSSRKAARVPKSSHGARASRSANLTFSATRVVIERPGIQSDTLPATIELNVVRVFEPKPPVGEEPIEWVLLTSEPIATADDVARVVDIYRARWLIEECNKALKTGCRYEDRQFESLEALLTLLAMTFPIACELLWLRAACRRNPAAPAAQVLTPLQLQILSLMGSRKLPKSPTTHDALWAVAGLGGHMKTNGEPGWLVLHRGMTKLLAYEEGWLAREKAEGLSISR